MGFFVAVTHLATHHIMSNTSQRPRTRSQAVSASAPVERLTVHLDGRSAVALEFASFYLARHASIRPAVSVVIRRALQLLAEHLSGLEGDDIGTEARAIREAGQGAGSALTLTQARARIEHHQQAPGAQPMARWTDALRSVDENRQGRDMLARLEAVMGAAS